MRLSNFTLKKKATLIISILLIIFTLGTFRESILVSFYPLVRSVEKHLLINKVKEYEVIETNNFIIRYDNGDKENAKLTGKIAEKYYEDIKDIYNYSFKEKVNIVVYQDKDQLMKNTRLKGAIPPLGVYYGGAIHANSPDNWVNDKENLEYEYELKGPIVHEIAHYIIDDITKGNYPMWLTEGMALYTEYKLTGFEWGKDMKTEKISVETLEKKFESIDQTVAYRESFNVIKDISENWGFEKLNVILEDLGRGKNLNKTTKAVLKTNLYEIN